MLAPAQAWNVLESADEVCSAAAIAQAVQRMAADITRVLADHNPLVLSVLSGAVVFTGQLLPLLKFPLDFDYLHLTRYGSATQGGRIEWKVFPHDAIAGRVVLVLDDILDEGHTMVEIRTRILSAGAARFYCAAFAEKLTGMPRQIAADFVGVQLPNRFVFGFGMDIRGAWRNLPAIYAVKEQC